MKKRALFLAALGSLMLPYAAGQNTLAPAQKAGEAQIFEIPEFTRLAAKAVESVEVNLDANMLRMAARFLSDKDSEEVKIRQLLGEVKGIYVRSLQFAKEGEYSLDQVEQMRAQISGSGWSKVVDVRSSSPKGDNAGVYMHMDGERILGVVVLAAEPKELTVVNIVGSIDPEHLRDLSGKFGIPALPGGEQHVAPEKKPGAKK